MIHVPTNTTYYYSNDVNLNMYILISLSTLRTSSRFSHPDTSTPSSSSAFSYSTFCHSCWLALRPKKNKKDKSKASQKEQRKKGVKNARLFIISYIHPSYFPRRHRNPLDRIPRLLNPPLPPHPFPSDHRLLYNYLPFTHDLGSSTKKYESILGASQALQASTPSPKPSHPRPHLYLPSSIPPRLGINNQCTYWALDVFIKNIG